MTEFRGWLPKADAIVPQDGVETLREGHNESTAGANYAQPICGSDHWRTA